MQMYQYKNFLQQYPQLTSYGFGVPGGIDFAQGRHQLESAHSEFSYCQAYLAPRRKRKNINRRLTSYGLKHDIEHWIEKAYGKHVYISEGVAIAAALSLGFRYRQRSGGRSCCFNIGR